MQAQGTASFFRRVPVQAAALAALLTVTLASAALAPSSAGAKVLPPGSHPYGQTYAQWSARWWQWNLSLPLTSPGATCSPNHPSIDSTCFDVTEGQQDPVWFLSSPLPGTFERTCTVPDNVSLFFPSLASEWSDLEGIPVGDQLALALYFGDHAVNLFCTIDGVPVQHLSAFRVTSPQFGFTAPSPWIFGATGGTGTAVSDGYFFMLAPLSAGGHTLHYGGRFLFTLAADGFDLDLPLDMTYHLTVTEDDEQ